MSSFTSGGEYLVPVRIHADRGAAVLEMEWPDGHVTRYDFETLRWLCPCAYCRGEAGMPGWLNSNPTLTPAQTQLTDLQLVGTYALQPTWADGHHTGFYTFARLREECPCAEDTAGGAPAGRARRAPQAAADRAPGLTERPNARLNRPWPRFATAPRTTPPPPMRRCARACRTPSQGAGRRLPCPTSTASCRGSTSMIASCSRPSMSATRCSSVSGSWPSSPAISTSSFRCASPG